MSIQTIMTADQSGKEMVDFASLTAKNLVRSGLTRAQIRNIFTEVRRIEALWATDSSRALRRLNMLKPKLAYQTKRMENREGSPLKPLQDILSEAIDEVEKSQDKNQAFDRFVDLFEAILAYHRAEGGRN